MSDFDDDDTAAAIRAGVDAATAWPGVAADSMAAQFDCARKMLSRTSKLIPPPSVTPGGGSLWDGVTAAVSAVEAQTAEVHAAVTASVISDVTGNAVWFGIPVPADISGKGLPNNRI